MKLRIEVHQFFVGDRPNEPSAITCWSKSIEAKDELDASIQANHAALDAAEEYENRETKNFRKFTVNANLRPMPIWQMSWPSAPHIQR